MLTLFNLKRLSRQCFFFCCNLSYGFLQTHELRYSCRCRIIIIKLSLWYLFHLFKKSIAMLSELKNKERFIDLFIKIDLVPQRWLKKCQCAWTATAKSTFCMVFWRKAVRTELFLWRGTLTGSKKNLESRDKRRYESSILYYCRQQRGSCGSERVVPSNLSYVHLYTRALSDVNSVSRHTALTSDTNYSPLLEAGHSIDVHSVCVLPRYRVFPKVTW